jgi:hypothetical protein
MADPLVHFIPVSRNSKTGPIAVSMTESSSCPQTCPFINSGCYASYGRTLLHWRKVPERGLPWSTFIAAVSRLNHAGMFRHNVAGDLPHIAGYISDNLVMPLAQTAGMLAASWTYTHHKLHRHNLAVIRKSIAYGFTINVSCESTHVAALNALRGLPTVCVVPPEAPTCFREEGVTFVQCPATWRDDINCQNCGGPRGKPLCARADRKVVVTFPAHGPGRNKAAAVARTSA